MIKYELEGETYYYINGKFFDSHYIEVDNAIKLKLAQMTGQEVISGYIKKNVNAENLPGGGFIPLEKQAKPNFPSLRNSNILNTGCKENSNISKIDEEHVSVKPLINKSKSTQNSISIKKPTLSDFGLAPQDIQKYAEKKSAYEKAYKNVQDRNREFHEEKDRAFTTSAIIVFFGTIFGSMILYAACSCSTAEDIERVSFDNYSFGWVIGGFILSLIVAIVQYHSRIDGRGEVALPQMSSFISKDLENKIIGYKEALEEYDSKLKEYQEAQKRQKASYWNNLGGFEFEAAVARLFKNVGAKANVTKKVGDQGIDIEVTYNGVKYAVQCKHHAKPVGPGPVRELRGVVQGEFKKGIFVSLNGYTESVVEENKSADRPVILLDREKLIRIQETQNLNLYLK